LAAAGMLAQVATSYGAQRPSVSPLSANEPPTSTTSGALLLPLSSLIALISFALEPSGFASVILIPYLAVKSFMMLP
jgi:hypothetical protein